MEWQDSRLVQNYFQIQIHFLLSHISFFEEITGYSKDEAFNKPLVSTFIVEKLRPSVQQVLDNALQGNETSNYELEFETKSKEIRYLLGTSAI